MLREQYFSTGRDAMDTAVNYWRAHCRFSSNTTRDNVEIKFDVFLNEEHSNPKSTDDMLVINDLLWEQPIYKIRKAIDYAGRIFDRVAMGWGYTDLIDFLTAHLAMRAGLAEDDNAAVEMYIFQANELIDDYDNLNYLLKAICYLLTRVTLMPSNSSLEFLKRQSGLPIEWLN